MIVRAKLNLEPLARDLSTGGELWEAGMTDWHDKMVDRPQRDDPGYAAGWTISGLAVLGTIVVVWVLGF